MSETVQDLRKHLFETIMALKDPANPMDIARAKAISDVAQVLVDTAKVEIDFMKVTGTKGTGFVPELPDESQKPQLPGPGATTAASVVTVRQRSKWQTSR